MIQGATQQMLSAVNEIIIKARSLHKGIPETVVVLGASGGGSKHGHFAANSWKGRDSDDLYGEVLLSGESLSRGAVPTLGTVLHELAHAYCFAHDIQDTSNAGRYHNKKFQGVAEKFGLHIEKAETIGYSVTTVPDSTQATYKTEIEALDEAITTHRRSFLGLAASSNPQKKRKMQCPECRDPLLVTKKWFEANEFNLKCDQHNQYFEMFEEE